LKVIFYLVTLQAIWPQRLCGQLLYCQENYEFLCSSTTIYYFSHALCTI